MKREPKTDCPRCNGRGGWSEYMGPHIGNEWLNCPCVWRADSEPPLLQVPTNVIHVDFKRKR